MGQMLAGFLRSGRIESISTFRTESIEMLKDVSRPVDTGLAVAPANAVSVIPGQRGCCCWWWWRRCFECVVRRLWVPNALPFGRSNSVASSSSTSSSSSVAGVSPDRIFGGFFTLLFAWNVVSSR
mmetsp:Transcript_115829/g.236794  ORF Transcript_115829/g.236794 Transcript_115829/m.236794 type:complete len:125 (+) Transcript_115829:1702-2076(+)